MKEIPLTQGLVALIDDADLERVSQHKWHAAKRTGSGYKAMRKACISGKRFTLLMHRFIMDAQPGQEIDHIDRNPLNNQRSNLRFVTRQQNMVNTGLLRSNTSGYRGVSFCKRMNKWRAYIYPNGKTTPLGYFDTAKAAAHAYDAAAYRVYGDFAQLNFPRAIEQLERCDA